MILANALDLWNSAWPAGVTMLGLGGVFALVLLVASEKLKVEIDPKIEQIHEALPNIDCGACGFAGCASYAKAVAGDAELIGKCAPGGAETSAAIAGILNIQVGGSADAPLRPIVHCRAHNEDKVSYAEYHGIESCTAANALAIVQACKFGCLGFGDCVRACKFDALHVVEKLSTVDYEKCTGCTACAKACPRNLIEMVPFGQENMITVACSSQENGKSTKGACKVGCIGCKLCTKQSEIFSMAGNVAKTTYVDFKPDEKTQTAYDKCPTGVIVYRGKSAVEPRAAGEKSAKKE